MATMRSPESVVDRVLPSSAHVPVWQPPDETRRSAGEPGWTPVDADVRTGSARPAMSEKMSHASRKFMTTPASRITQPGAEPLVDEARGIGRLALLPLEPHEAADGQPVEGVDGLLARWRIGRAGREADAELVDPDAGAARDDEVAELVEHHQDHQDGQQQDDVDAGRRGSRGGHPARRRVRGRAPRRAPRASSCDQLVDVRLGCRTESLDRAGGQRRATPGEVERALEEAARRPPRRRR